jgi:hypothetical protein
MEQAAPNSNVVVLICPSLKCGRVLQVPERYRGQIVRCRFCQTTFSVPANSPKASTPESNDRGGPLI